MLVGCVKLKKLREPYRLQHYVFKKFNSLHNVFVGFMAHFKSQSEKWPKNGPTRLISGGNKHHNVTV